MNCETHNRVQPFFWFEGLIMHGKFIAGALLSLSHRQLRQPHGHSRTCPSHWARTPVAKRDPDALGRLNDVVHLLMPGLEPGHSRQYRPDHCMFSRHFLRLAM